jgi:hypothetical protein
MYTQDLHSIRHRNGERSGGAPHLPFPLANTLAAPAFSRSLGALIGQRRLLSIVRRVLGDRDRGVRHPLPLR